MGRKNNNDFGLTRNAVATEKLKLKAREDFLRPSSTISMDFSSDDIKQKYHFKKSKKHKKRSARKIARLIVLTAVFIFVVATTSLGMYGNTLVSKLTSGRSGLFSLLSTVLGARADLRTDENGRINVLVFGTSGYEMSGSGHDGAELTDSIMVVSFDKNNKDLSMVNLPRDLLVGTCTTTGKVNEVYWCANQNGDNEESGAAALQAKIYEVLGVNTQYRVHVDWGALIQIVDNLGGITVTLDEDIEDDWTGTFIKAGEPVTLNGERALGLARARHGTSGGDFTRGNSQQKILIALQEKILQDGVSFTQALGLVEAIGDNVRMDFKVEELRTLLDLAQETSLSDMRQVPLVGLPDGGDLLTTGTVNGISYVLPMDGQGNYARIKDYIYHVFLTAPEKETSSEKNTEEETYDLE